MAIETVKVTGIERSRHIFLIYFSDRTHAMVTDEELAAMFQDRVRISEEPDMNEYAGWSTESESTQA